MMDVGDSPSAVICKLCGETFTLPEHEVDGNLPRALLCGHIFCTNCLLSIQYDGVIRCTDCEVESTLPETGVYGLQEESRIIGLIYSAKMNKMRSLRCDKSRGHRKNRLSPSGDINTGDIEQPADVEKIKKTVDEALVRAAENLIQLEHINETLTAGLSEQGKRERVRLEMEIKQASDKALHAVQKWKDLQLNQLTKLEEQSSTRKAAVSQVQERIKTLETAMQMAREVRRFPFLEQYCILDKVLETLQAPVDDSSFDMKCIAVGTGMSCVFRSENVSQCLTLSLKMEISSSNSPQEQGQENSGADCLSSHGSPSSSRACSRISLSHHDSFFDLNSPDVIVEELLDEEQEQGFPGVVKGVPLTGPELANVKWRKQRKEIALPPNKRNVNQWVVLTHVVNPSHFYVHYVAEKREGKILSKKINQLCFGDGCCFAQKDAVESGSLIFVKWKDGLWCRTRVCEVLQKGCMEAVKTCPVTRLASLRVFFPDYGFTKSITLQNEEGTAESTLKSLNNHLRKASEAVNVKLRHFAPQAIRCSLKDLVPYDLTKGWSKESKVEFYNVIGSAAVVMKILGQDRDSLLVDLKKAPMEQSSDVPISIREYLVFIEVARFYAPVTLGRSPLLYYSPVHPKTNTKLDAVVSHINNPADFYIQLVDNRESLLLSAKLQDCYNAATVFADDELNIYCPVIGQACVARFDDKLWYRAQVIGHPGEKKVEVLYVDFGNKTILSVSDLRKIKDEFFALPAMAIHCCLADVVPVDGEEWSEACTNRFTSLAHQQLVTIVATAKVPKNHPVPIRLLKGGRHELKTNISELLVKEELAAFKKGLKPKNAKSFGDDSAVWDPPLDLSSAAEVDSVNQIITEEQNEKPLEFQPQLKLPDNLKDIKVRVSHTNSPSSFYVQLADFDSHLKRICEAVKQECARMEPQDVAWKADMFCAAHINGVWERGQICADVTSSNKAEVKRCDHGNSVKLHVSNLRPLPPSLIGSLALECTLNDIRPAGGRSVWTDTACDLFSYYLTGASALMTVKVVTDEHPVPVTLLRSNKKGEFISIADFLVSEGLALKERKPRADVVNELKQTETQPPVSDEIQTNSTTENSSPPPVSSTFSSGSSVVSISIPPKPTPRLIMSAEKVKTSLYHPPELPCLGPIQITVSAVGDDGLIYVRTQNAEYHLEQLREKIQQSMKTLPRQKPYTWKSVQGCAVIGPDMLWYRGQLLELQGGHVKVQYVDYGLVENIPVVHVYPVLLCVDVPQLCVSCHLLGINPVGGRWQRDAVALMRELLLNRSLDLQVVELPAEPREPLTVELFLDGLSLSQILCHHKHATMNQSPSPQKALTVMPPAPVLDDWDINTKGLLGPEEPVLGPFVDPNLPQKGERFKVRVKHLWTPNELFLWPLEEMACLEVEGETLDEALTRINANNHLLQQLTSFPFGAPCLAEYSDGNYYRARLMKITSVEPVLILVQHVDFGSDDTLPPNKLRQMPAELLQFPSQALKVKVTGFKAPAVSWNEDVLPYSPKWSVKAVKEMLDLLHSNITATIVSREPELKVQLYDEDGELVHLPLLSSGLAELD
ncbi:RING finger protein 17 isoform X2 [Kryptolebias marmoratus]|uniref:RING finger protein 17 isoform X2 n=1 Tax=Kryptolebias marmoratus TaxID=37003 RepID=UPI000D52FF37|nr:RING finger protein 17 isoform X2 [Kryptolebias marmoratus]